MDKNLLYSFHSTKQLQEAILDFSSLSSFLTEITPAFYKSFPDHLYALIMDRQMNKASLARNAKISEIYLYQLVSGKRNPSRNLVICLGIGLHCTMDELQELLRVHCSSELNIRHRRDAIIMYGIVHHLSLKTINAVLLQEDMQGLISWK